MSRTSVCPYVLKGCLALSLVYTALAQPPGSISGTITGDDGKSVPAVVSVLRTGPTAGGGRAEANANGSFTISNLPGGSYKICARPKSAGYLDPCAWNADTPAVPLTAGQSLTGYRLIVRKGSVVEVRLNDSTKLLDARAAPGQTVPHVVIGIMNAKHLFEPLAVTAKDNNGRTHEGTVPLDGASSLFIAGKGVRITDKTGAVLNAAGAAVAVKPNGSAPRVILTFDINPAKP